MERPVIVELKTSIMDTTRMGHVLSSDESRFTLDSVIFVESSSEEKVHPETDDDMVRRIKSMLGEYVHESEFSVNESIECEMKEMEHIPSQSSEIHSNSESSHQKVFEEGNAEENSVVINKISTDTKECMESVEKSSNDKVVSLNNDEVVEDHIDNCQNVVSEEPSANSRRCSLKRQCKERISLLDYNPMFTIRTKRTKGNVNKGKSTENLDVSNILKLYSKYL
ncbi:uncharacterized protein TNCV_3112451 [Trichonephila clavipes]|nr:uncharacterized protein TNCV_3112451 [Trichonephila clavipes]